MDQFVPGGSVVLLVAQYRLQRRKTAGRRCRRERGEKEREGGELN